MCTPYRATAKLHNCHMAKSLRLFGHSFLADLQILTFATPTTASPLPIRGNSTAIWFKINVGGRDAPAAALFLCLRPHCEF